MANKLYFNTTESRKVLANGFNFVHWNGNYFVKWVTFADFLAFQNRTTFLPGKPPLQGKIFLIQGFMATTGLLRINYGKRVNAFRLAVVKVLVNRDLFVSKSWFNDSPGYSWISKCNQHPLRPYFTVYKIYLKVLINWVVDHSETT